MRTQEKQLIIRNPEAGTLPEALGISIDRAREITTQVDEIVKDVMSSKGKQSDAVTRVYNNFENRAENAFAMFILTHEEEQVTVVNLMSPEVVEE